MNLIVDIESQCQRSI